MQLTQPLKHWLALTLVLSLLLGASVLARPAVAQETENTVVTVTAPAWMGYFLDDDDLITEFEELYPGSSFVFVESPDDLFFRQTDPDAPFSDLLDNAEELASQADVIVTMGPEIITPYTTVAGYFLDLRPLIQTDVDLNPADYYPRAWEAYQWDGGTWGVPASLSLRFFMYNPQAFDQAAVQYPSARWTLDDLALAIRNLTEYDADGEVVAPGYIGFGLEQAILRGILGQGFYDEAILPNPPMLDNPALAELLSQWEAYNEEGLFQQQPGPDTDFQQIPLRGEGFYSIVERFEIVSTDGDLSGGGGGGGIGTVRGGDGEPLEFLPAVLPGGVTQMDVQAFAVSAGTRHPEAAYNLARFLADRYAINFGGGDLPALRDTADLGVEIVREYREGAEGFVDVALDAALTPADLRFADGLHRAMNLMMTEGFDATTALQTAQQETLENFQLAQERAATTVIEVAPPPEPVQLAEGEIGLTFGISAFGPSLPNRDQWDNAVADFVASEPSIGNVELETRFFSGDPEAQVDCYYSAFNDLQFIELENLLSMDPFLDTDPNFDPQAIASGVQEQLQREGLTWGYPLTMQPVVLYYDSNRFNEAGIPSPRDGWSADEFAMTVEDLSQAFEPDQATPLYMGSTQEILALVAGFGGLPYDFRQQPALVNFTEPETVSAIQRVLDLAKNDTIAYQPLTQAYQQLSSGGIFGAPIIYIGGMNPFRFGSVPGSSPEENPIRTVNLPTNGRYIPVQYEVGAAFITAQTLYPEACYNWISFIAQRPELLLGAPANTTLLDDPSVEASLGADMIETLRQLVEQVDSPNAVSFSNRDFSQTTYLEQLWLLGVFDAYVLGDDPIDLNAALADAEAKTLAFRACMAAVPPFQQPSPDLPQAEIEQLYEDYQDQIDLCGLEADPEYVSPFQPPS